MDVATSAKWNHCTEHSLMSISAFLPVSSGASKTKSNSFENYLCIQNEKTLFLHLDCVIWACFKLKVWDAAVWSCSLGNRVKKNLFLITHAHTYTHMWDIYDMYHIYYI